MRCLEPALVLGNTILAQDKLPKGGGWRIGAGADRGPAGWVCEGRRGESEPVSCEAMITELLHLVSLSGQSCASRNDPQTPSAFLGHA